MSTSVRRRSRTRERLLDALEELLQETGTLSPKIDEICSRAGFTRGAFYSNFSTIEEILFAVYERRTAQVLAGLATTREPGGHTDEDDAPSDLAATMETFLRAVPADPQWYALRAAFAARAPHDSGVAAALHEHAEELRRGLTPMVTVLADSAGLDLPGDGSDATRAVIAAHIGAVLQGPFVTDPEQLRRDTVLAVLRGLSPAAGTTTAPPSIEEDPA
ncbi:TetR/AcrR family transcriptional regulator [Brachybacterium sp. ACRRE]|uniref:TetR/AcrR family transcriptional regulator n=1 Tax=Brachybacterium sp. ACRRE TaxID=2918184 RepID=UPI001EF2F803|nr:TetR/AcrR family transcriptional regulator [Brachybacterium sp. ACRRE]MCG7308327.1 TetR/AcrR family transcriptional regulator [Brachybacterium sp. ACRRE]